MSVEAKLTIQAKCSKCGNTEYWYAVDRGRVNENLYEIMLTCAKCGKIEIIVLDIEDLVYKAVRTLNENRLMLSMMMGF